MMRIERLYLEFPFAGAGMLRGLLRQEGFIMGRKWVGRLMKRMAIEALYCKPRTTKSAVGHKIDPCLLRHLQVAWAK
jgi:putative transposase